MRYGSYDEGTLSRLRWLGDVLAPALDEAVRRSDPLDLIALVAEGLRRGDDCHNRLVATSAALLAALTPGLLRAPWTVRTPRTSSRSSRATGTSRCPSRSRRPRR